jgi:hypothetical protein
VHDSPDYYKLKCSVFNDDKKTDLIGDAWIDLSGVMVPGGGKNDLWHQLQFKGKYAGDVRMELTYYDTRPKDGMVLEKRRQREKAEQGRANSSKSDDAGPRKLGPREVKRRPLPTDPLVSTSVDRPSPPEQAHSAPIPQLYQYDSMHNSQQEYNDQWGPDSHYHVQTSNERSHYPAPPLNDRSDYDLPTMHNDYQLTLGATDSHSPHHLPSSYDNFGRPVQLPDSDDPSFHSAPSSFPTTPALPLNHTSFIDGRRHSAQQSDTRPNRSSTYPELVPYGSSPPSVTHDSSASELDDYQNRTSCRRYSTSPIKNDVFRDSPLRQSVSQHDVEPTFEAQYDVSEDEGPPPPPPAHRSNLSTSASPRDARQDMQPVQVPQPLKLGSNKSRMSPFDRSPLQTIERNYDPEHRSSVPFLPSSVERENTFPSYSKPTYTTGDQRARGNSYDRPMSGIENTPPSLRSGYGRGVEENDDAWMRNERSSHKQSLTHTSPADDRDFSMLDHSVPYQRPQVEDERQMFTSEAPFVKPQAISPDPRIVPKRKAISPQPLLNQDERGSSSVPFGPDSYDIFNPSSPLSSVVAGPESRYETPEQAKEVARQHEVQKLRDQGPIIGNDGRVIDPSDHLPTDTWAPEPERKSRKPEMVIRYKTKETTPRTPQGYGSSPGSARLHSFAGPVYGSSPLAAESPPSLAHQSGRNRLQKQIPGRPLPVQPYQQTYSSPAVPAASHSTPSPRSNYSSRPDLSEYSLHGQQNQRNSYGGLPGGQYGGVPPIPAKIPISPIRSEDRYAGYGGMDALSAELSTIDIGAGMGGRGGRTRRGYGL